MADIELTRTDLFAIITLNRPEKRNALTLQMWRQIPDLVADACAGRSRAIIVQGAGGHFTAGADIGEFSKAYATKEAALANHATMQAAMQALENCDLPVLARIEGTCVGGGCSLALSCDMRWASPNATFAITPARLGLAYSVADTHRLVRAVGLSRAKEMLFTARALDAATAAAWGLIDRVLPAETSTHQIDALAHALNNAARYSLHATKHIARKVAEGAVTDDDETCALFAAAFAGADFAEGFAAFMQKRPTRFS